MTTTAKPMRPEPLGFTLKEHLNCTVSGAIHSLVSASNVMENIRAAGPTQPAEEDDPLSYAESLLRDREDRHQRDSPEGFVNNNSHPQENARHGETQVLMKHMLQRMQQQEFAIQQLQDTVNTQNTTLQEIMSTMKAGFASIMMASTQQRQPTSVAAEESAGTRLSSPERDHPSLGATTLESSTLANKDCFQGHSLTEHSQSRRAPPRQASCDLSSLGMAGFEDQQLSSGKNKETVNKAADQDKVVQPSYGKKSSSELLDDDDSEVDDGEEDALLHHNNTCIDASVESHNHDHHSHDDSCLNSSATSAHADDPAEHHQFDYTSFRERFATGSSERCKRRSFVVSKDKMPSPPTYVASPCTKFSANRMPTRLSRATSAPLASLRGGRRTSKGTRQSEMPRLPPRLPPRMPTRDDSVDSGTNNNEGSKKTRNDTNNDLDEEYTLEMEDVVPKTESDEDGILEGLPDIKMKRAVSTATTSTSTTLPRIPTRYASISDGLDATAILNAPSSDDADKTENAIHIASSSPEPDEVPNSVAYSSSGCDLTSSDGDMCDSEDQVKSGVRANSPTRPPNEMVPVDRPEEASSSSIVFLHLNNSRSSFLSHSSGKSWMVKNQVVSTGTSADAAGAGGLRNSFRSTSRGSKRDIFAQKGLQHLHVSCVTLDSALVDESHEWIGDEDDTSTSNESTTLGGHDPLNDGKAGDGSHAVSVVDVNSEKLVDHAGDSGVYSGSLSTEDNLPHGKGLMRYDNGKFYNGEWDLGYWHGKGVLLSATGDSYNGDFVHSTRHGRGLYEYDNGDSYDGDFNADKPHGKGTFRFADGGVYYGGFIFGSFEGQGWYEFDGGRYEGEWRAGCYDGHGTLQYADKSSYTGQFQAGKATGMGEEVSADGVVRVGLWKQGELVQENETSTGA
ncbi:whole genome shotgun sequence [Seminavis robusta]|uniref:Whole genome shotgun sequence n=1 Tax=Seminavis robusta TaxID=568900 RepID=A0A9N8EE22_9STRA|nr:whole genome shotgun sequence [Seminavis robusta]|eukprot:Sro1042_g234680.1 whole genome shotgun sequence (905) ;mRNA; r:13886-16600